jgi:archaellum component FlaG (FlaF/FlaG flagellin family)
MNAHALAVRECAGIAGTLHQQLMRLQTAMADLSCDEADRIHEDLEAVASTRHRLSVMAARIGRRK